MPLNVSSIEVDKQFLEKLCKEQIPEDEQLEFKTKLPTWVGRNSWHAANGKIGTCARDAILAEIVAFANTRGGFVLVGIRESEDKPHRAIGIEAVPRCHDLSDRLRQEAYSMIEPPLTDFEVSAVPTEDDDAGVVVLRVGTSRNAPHCLMGNRNECYTRRGDGIERITMREIQDLTLNTALGMAVVESRLESLRAKFERRAKPQGQPAQSPGGKAVLRTGIGVYVVPVVSIQLHRDDPAALLAESRRKFLVSLSNRFRFEAVIPVYGHKTRTVLRGSSIFSNTTDSYFEHSLYTDGAQSCEFFTFVPTDKPRVAAVVLPEWIVAGTASALGLAKLVAATVRSPSTEFVVELQVCSQGGKPRLGISAKSGFRYVEMERSNLIFPRYSFVGSDAIEKLLNEVVLDTYSAAGTTTNDRIASVS